MILITGGMGFIGLHTARRFLDVGQEVVITRFSQWREPAFIKDEYGKRVHVERVDVASPHDLLGLVQKYGVTHIVHFAVPGLGALTPAEDFRVHTMSLLNVLEAARLSGVQRVVVGSSHSVYSGLREGPFREDAALPVESPPGMTYSGVDPFLRAKEILGLHYTVQTGLDIIFARLANIYGPLYHTMVQPWSRMCMAAVQDTQPDFSTSANGVPFEDFSGDYCYATDCAVGVDRDSPDQTNFPGNSSFWDTVKYNPAFQGRQMRPDSLKFPVFI